MAQLRKTIIVELNEFNRDLLVECSQRFRLKTLSRYISLNETKTFSTDTYESDYLEPWSQWVTVHTGRPSTEHQIKHLGDISKLHFPQIWERLSQQKITTGVWGVLNGSRGNAPSCQFFVPDPWTFSEDAYPSRLSYLVDLPRYIVKNRKQLKLTKIIGLAISFLAILKNVEVLKAVLTEMPRLLLQTMKDGIKEYSFFSVFEYFSTLEFIRMHQKTQPEVSFLFLNSMAHAQHYYWDFSSPMNVSRFQFTMSMIEQALTKLDQLDCDIVLYNSLSQTSTVHEDPWIGYRPIDHDEFLKTLNVSYSEVEPLMSFDAILLFENQENLVRGKKILESLNVNGKPLLHVESYNEDPLRLFYRVIISHQVGPEERVLAPEYGIDFLVLEKLSPIAVRTGKHIPVGNIFSNLSIYPPMIENKDVMGYLETHFRSQTVNAGK